MDGMVAKQRLQHLKSFEAVWLLALISNPQSPLGTQTGDCSTVFTQQHLRESYKKSPVCGIFRPNHLIHSS